MLIQSPLHDFGFYLGVTKLLPDIDEESISWKVPRIKSKIVFVLKVNSNENFIFFLHYFLLSKHGKSKLYITQEVRYRITHKSDLKLFLLYGGNQKNKIFAALYVSKSPKP